jgi:hypothetical protein
MKRCVFLLMAALVLVGCVADVNAARQEAPLAQEEVESVADRFYFVPVEVMKRGDSGAFRRPKYFYTNVEDPPGSGQWRIVRGPITSRVAMMDYGAVGLMNFGLILAVGISDSDHNTYMAANAYNEPTGNQDVYVIPLDYNTAVTDPPGTRAYFEGFGVPTDWLTPSNTYLELMRLTAGMFQFAQRYYGISGEVLLARITMDTKYRDFLLSEQVWFDATVNSFGYDPGIIKPNDDLRQMLKTAGSLWEDQPFMMAGQEF